MADLTASAQKKIVLGVVALLAAVELFFYNKSTTKPSEKSLEDKSTSAVTSKSENSPSLARSNQPNVAKTEAGLRADDAPSHLADLLNSSTTDIHADLRLLDDIFQQYRSAMHGDDPIGDNKDITAILSGKNKLDFAFIPKSCPAINAQGELCDRWGTPFYFHQLSGTDMQIRSAGPDKKLYTTDDEVLTPWLYPPHL